MTYVVAYLINGIVFGAITRYVANTKGYDGGFWWGFFLGIVGLLVVGFRPNISQVQEVPYVSKYSAQPQTSVGAPRAKTWVCNCGSKNPPSSSVCLSCRKNRSQCELLPEEKINCPQCNALNKISNKECFACHASLIKINP